MMNKTLLSLTVGGLLLATNLQAATIVIVNGDAAGVGFNDPTVVAPVGDNLGVTLGAQRLNVFQAAANQWGAVLNSAVDIRILATFEPLTCSGTSAVLGSAGAIGVFRGFTNNPGAPYDDAWFSAAESNALAGSDQDGGNDDIRARFNLDIDNGTCLNGTIGWWYDTNGANPIPNNRIALMPVVFHEIAHGLGFQTYTNTATGQQLGTPNKPSIWDHFLMDRNDSVGGTTWVNLNNPGRQASAIDDPFLVWSGANVTAAAQGYLDPAPNVEITAPGAIAGNYDAQPASFGPLVPLNGVSGEVVPTVGAAGTGTTTDGCQPITNGAAVNGNIALIDRGTCNFTVKVANAEAVGAIAVLVANNVANGLPGMGGSDPSIMIPSYGVSQALGTAIRANLPVDAILGFNFANLAGMNGGYLRMYAPNPRVAGSSVSHFSTAASPNLLMEPNLNQELFSETDMTVPLFRDIFWPINNAAIANKPPFVNAAAEFVVDLDIPTPLTEIVFGDIDAATNDIEVAFDVDGGTISLNAAAGVTPSGSGTASASIVGARNVLLPYVIGGNVLFTTDLGDSGDVQLIITVDDLGNSGTGGALTAQDSATIKVNLLPVALDDGDYATLEDTMVTTGNVLGNDTLGDAPTTITAFDASSAQGGTVSNNGDGTFDYTPALDYNGGDSFTYTITDNDGEMDTATVSLTVTSVNDAPSFTKGADQSVVEDSGAQSVVGWATALSTGPADESGQTLSFNVTNNTNASLFSAGPSIAANGDLSYTPAAGTSGSADITIELMDDGGTTNGGVDTSATQTFTITVTPINHIPSFTKGADEAVNEDAGAQNVAGWATSIDDGDGGTQALTFNVANNTNASLFSSGPSIAANGDLSYTPAANANGSADITIELMDDGGTAGGGVDTSAGQTFTITVGAVNDAPSFTKGADQSVVEDSGAQSVVGWATALSTGPADESGQTLSFNVTNNTNASLFSAGPSIAANGDLSYTPAAGTSGSADITLSLSDDGGTANGGVDTSATQTFTITVTPINHIPSFTKGADEAVNEDAGAQSVTGWATSIDDGDGGTQALTFNVTNNTNASLFSSGPSIAANGDLSYAPAANANGSADITIELMDDGGTAGGGVDTSASQVFTITVNAVNDVPVAIDDGYGVNEGGTLAATTVKANDTDVEDGTPGGNVSLVAGPSNASAFTLNPDGTFSYTHDGSETTTDSFTYTVQDANGADSNTATVTITVMPVDDGPAVANDDSANVTQGSTGNLIDVLANDVADPDDGSLNLTSVGTPGNGTAVISGSQISYTPTAGYCGDDSFTYEVNGGISATVNVTIGCSDPDIFKDGFEL